MQQERKLLSYLPHDNQFNFDINFAVHYKLSQLSELKTVCKSNFRHLCWTAKQMLVNHTVTGRGLNFGDLLGTGTISGPDVGSFDSMMELA